MKCYTNVTCAGNSLYVTGIDENNQRVRFFTDFTPTVWVKESFNYKRFSKDIVNVDFSSWKDFLSGNPMVALTFRDIKSAKNFIQKTSEVIFDDEGKKKVVSSIHTSPANMFESEWIAKNFDEHCGDSISPHLLRILKYDIETEIGHRNVSDRTKVKYRKATEDAFGVTYGEEKTISIGEFENLLDRNQYQLFDKDTNQWVSYELHPYRYIGGFPDPLVANEKVTLITVTDVNNNEIHTFGLENFKEKEGVIYHRCESEEELLKCFLDYWSSDYPDIMLGFNSRNFDNTYLAKRIEKVLGVKESNRLSPIGKVAVKTSVKNDFGQPIVETTFLGIAELDYLKLYKKFSSKTLESYRLDAIAELEVGIKKIENPTGGSFKDFYTGKFQILEKPSEKDSEIKKMGYVRSMLRKKLDIDPDNADLLKKYKAIDRKIVSSCKQLFIEYNIRDVQLIDKIESKQKLIDLAMSIAYLSHSNIQDVFSPVKLWEYLIFNRLYKAHQVVPIKNVGVKSEKFSGAYVKPPIIGKHEFCESFDLDSLYPHIIQEYNISPETMIRNSNGDPLIKKVSADKLVEGVEDLSDLKTLNYAMPASGVCFSKEKKGILPSLSEELYATRKDVKKKMLWYKSEHEKIVFELRKRHVTL